MYLFNLNKPNYGYRFNLRRFGFNFWLCLGILFIFILVPLGYFTHIDKGTQDCYVYGQRVCFNGSLQEKEHELITSKYNIPLDEERHVFYYGAIPYRPGEGINLSELPPRGTEVKMIQVTDEKLENSMRNMHTTMIWVSFFGVVFCLGAVLCFLTFLNIPLNI